ncbi:MAG: hypothetical protein R2809_14600 [Flavobacteriales bacterium]
MKNILVLSLSFLFTVAFQHAANAQGAQKEFENIEFAVGKNFGSLKGEPIEGGFQSKIEFSTASYTMVVADKKGNAHHLKIAFSNEDAGACRMHLERVLSSLELSLPIIEFTKKEASNAGYVDGKVTTYDPKNTDLHKFRVEVGVVNVKNGFEGVILIYPI